MLERSGWCALNGGILRIQRVLLVIILSIMQNLGCCLSQEPIDETDNLPASNHFRVDEVTVQIEDEVDDLGRVHSLLNVSN
jgi:hypothetical protein